MSNKLKDQFTNEMIKKSNVVLDKNSEFLDHLEKFVEQPEIANLTPDQRASEVMKFIQESNLVRPEIMLDRDSYISQLALVDDASFNSFRIETTLYQDNEQALLNERRNGVNISDTLLNENMVMNFQDPKYFNTVDDVAIDDSEKVLNDAFKNQKVIGDASQYQMFSNGNNVLSNVSQTELDELDEPKFLPLDKNESLEISMNRELGLTIGKESRFDYTSDLANINKFHPNNIKNLMADEESVLTRKQRIEQDIKDYMSGYEIDGNTYAKDGKRAFNVKKNLITRSIKRCHGGMNPSDETIVAMFLVSPGKDVLQFPYSEENVENFKKALMKIKEDDLFDLNEINISKKVDPAFKKALEEIKNGEEFTLGKDLKVEQKAVLEAPVNSPALKSAVVQPVVEPVIKPDAESVADEVVIGQDVETPDLSNGQNFDEIFNTDNLDEELNLDDDIEPELVGDFNHDDSLGTDDVENELVGDFNHDDNLNAPELVGDFEYDEDDLNPDDIEPELVGDFNHDDSLGTDDVENEIVGDFELDDDIDIYDDLENDMNPNFEDDLKADEIELESLQPDLQEIKYLKPLNVSAVSTPIFSPESEPVREKTAKELKDEEKQKLLGELSDATQPEPNSNVRKRKNRSSNKLDM